MSGNKKKAAALEEKLQLLRSVTKSNAGNNTSILVDASKYIRELKDKVDKAAAAAADADADDGSSSSTAASSGTVVVSVSSVNDSSGSPGSGFRINVSMARSRPGLLVSVLEALEELGLDVLDADVSCADDTPFRFQALSGRHQQQQQGTTTVDEQIVRQAVLQAINKCSGVHDGSQ